MDKKKFDYSVSAVRVVAMLMIVFCHLSSYFGQTAISHFFDIGVIIFLLISGYLYGTKEITRPINWFLNRIIRLYMPLLAYILVHMLSKTIRGVALPHFSHWLMLFTNTQGINRVFTFAQDVTGPWFFTVIMLCYLTLIPVKKLESHFKDDTNSLKKIGTIGCILFFVAFVILGIEGTVSLSVFLPFYTGYFIKKFETAKPNSKIAQSLLLAVILFVLGCTTRLVSRNFLDGTNLYNNVFVSISSLAISVAVMTGIRWIRNLNPPPIRQNLFYKTVQYC